jgi:hypothetical protein
MQNENHMSECGTYSERESYVRMLNIFQNVNHMPECELYVNVNHVSM